MVPLIKTRRGRWLILGTAILYGALWGLTHLVGTEQVRGVVTEDYLPGGDLSRLRACECSVQAVAPFLIEAQYLWLSGGAAGGGAKLLYAWFGVVSVKVWEWDHFAR